MLIDKKQEIIKTLEYLLTEIKNDRADSSAINELWDIFYSKPDQDHVKYLFAGWWLYLMNSGLSTGPPITNSNSE